MMGTGMPGTKGFMGPDVSHWKNTVVWPTKAEFVIVKPYVPPVIQNLLDEVAEARGLKSELEALRWLTNEQRLLMDVMSKDLEGRAKVAVEQAKLAAELQSKLESQIRNSEYWSERAKELYREVGQLKLRQALDQSGPPLFTKKEGLGRWFK